MIGLHGEEKLIIRERTGTRRDANLVNIKRIVTSIYTLLSPVKFIGIIFGGFRAGSRYCWNAVQ